MPSEPRTTVDNAGRRSKRRRQPRDNAALLIGGDPERRQALPRPDRLQAGDLARNVSSVPPGDVPGGQKYAGDGPALHQLAHEGRIAVADDDMAPERLEVVRRGRQHRPSCVLEPCLDAEHGQESRKLISEGHDIEPSRRACGPTTCASQASSPLPPRAIARDDQQPGRHAAVNGARTCVTNARHAAADQRI